MPALHEPPPAPESDEPDPGLTFHIFQNEIGRWCALSDDGMVLGIFFKRDAAIRFARDESDRKTPLMLLVHDEAKKRFSMQKAA